MVPTWPTTTTVEERRRPWGNGPCIACGGVALCGGEVGKRMVVVDSGRGGARGRKWWCKGGEQDGGGVGRSAGEFNRLRGGSGHGEGCGEGEGGGLRGGEGFGEGEGGGDGRWWLPGIFAGN
ncbi:glycine-rich protein 5-like [Spinacia oleracea]|uniref:Glycine-rich protein 5-like n=1 Tax=Spinacia oleracea TaxID=3562 RepID=A0ABM3R3Y5_SPIOL|nr:glycine-rich protein 5-like [Spinacia oleracea]